MFAVGPGRTAAAGSVAYVSLVPKFGILSRIREKRQNVPKMSRITGKFKKLGFSLKSCLFRAKNWQKRPENVPNFDFLKKIQ